MTTATITLCEYVTDEGTLRAAGANPSQARRAMRAALLAYGDARGLPRTWFRHVHVTESTLTLGVGYFDSGAITGEHPVSPVRHNPLAISHEG